MYDILKNIADPVGIGGVILLLVAYFGISTGRLSGDNIAYQLLNLAGAWLILFSLYFSWNTASVLIEIAWIIISIIGTFRIMYAKVKKPIRPLKID